MDEALLMTLVIVFGFGLFGVFVVAMGNAYSRVRIMRSFDKTRAIAELDQDTTNWMAKIVHTTDREIIFEKSQNETRRYIATPDAFKMMGGIPVIRYHHLSTEPASLKPYSQVLYNYIEEREVTEEVPTGKFRYNQETGEKTPVTETKTFLRPVIVRQEKKVYDRLISPQEMSALLTQKEAWADAWAIKLGRKLFENMQTMLIFVLILSILGLVASGMGALGTGDIKTIQASDHLRLEQLYNLTIEVKNDTARIPVPLKGIGGG